jgi:hypothetical protein
MFMRVSSSLCFGILLASGLAARAATTPRQVAFETKFDIGGSTVHVHGRGLATRTDFVVEAEGLEVPAAPQYTLVLHGLSEDRTAGQFSVDENGDGSQHFRINEDWRQFLLGLRSLRLMDGETMTDEQPVTSAAALRLSARALVGLSHQKQVYRLEGRVERRLDGRSRHDIGAFVEHGSQASLVFRLSGPDGTMDIPVEVNASGKGKTRLRGDDDLLAAAMQWTELIVLQGETEIVRVPLGVR